METLITPEPRACNGAASLGDPQTITDLLLYRFHRVLANAGALVTRMCEVEFGVTRREWAVLAMLAAHGPIGSTELATRAQLDRPTTSKAVTGLVTKLLIQRKARSGDARFNELALTERGEDLYQRMFPAIRFVSLDMLSPLAADEIALLDSMLSRIQRHAEQVAHASGKPSDFQRRGARAIRNQNSQPSRLPNLGDPIR